MNVVDKFYDLIDECCMLLYEKIHLNYFDSLVRVCKDITVEINEARLDDEDVETLKSKYDELTSLTITNEEVRMAMQLLIIKAMKHVNMRLDLMTPDYINYIIAYFVNYYCKDKKHISLLDVESGTGNLINAVSNFITMDADLVAVEHNKDLVELCKVSSDMQNNEVDIYFQDVLNKINGTFDCIIGDLDCEEKDNKYLPYEIICAYTENLKEDGIFIYLIENDFFTKSQLQEFKKKFEGTLLGLVVLPNELFQKDHVGKSLLIGTKQKLNHFEMVAMQMPSVNNKEKFYNSLEEIKIWIDKVKENIK